MKFPIDLPIILPLNGANIAPKLIGGAEAKGPIGGAGIPKMADALALDDMTITRLGDDLLVEGRIRKD